MIAIFLFSTALLASSPPAETVSIYALGENIVIVRPRGMMVRGRGDILRLPGGGWRMPPRPCSRSTRR
jgi:hypothetical protein